MLKGIDQSFAWGIKVFWCGALQGPLVTLLHQQMTLILFDALIVKIIQYIVCSG